MFRASSSRHLAPRAGFLIACLLGVVACFPDPPADRDTLDTAPDVSDDTGLGELDAAADTTNDSGGGELDTAHDSELEAALDTASEDVNDGAVDAVPDTLADTAETSASDTAPEVSPEDTEQADTAVAIDTHVDGAADTVNDLEADTVDTAEPETDTAEPDADPCPGGCAHLDEPCRRGACGATGCESVIIEGACDDAQACTTGDRCEAGECVGDPIVCTARDSCHIAGVCDPSTGKCSEPSKPNGTECDDADHCTEGEACVAGVCSGGAVPDDSGDWARLVPSLGPSELVYDGDGDLWWFVSLIAPMTDFGNSSQGGAITLSLPVGSNHGVGAVRLDASGKPVSAMLLAHSAANLEIPPLPDVTAGLLASSDGRKFPIVVMTSDGPVSFGTAGDDVTYIPRAGARLTYFVAFFNPDGTHQNVMQIESAAFSAIGDLRATNYPGVAVSASGQVALAIPLEPDETAEIVGKATVRGTPGAVASRWVVKIGSGAVLWQRVLEGASPTFSIANVHSLSIDSMGGIWMSGWYLGRAIWRRVDELEPLEEIPDIGDAWGMFVTRIDGAAQLEATNVFRGNARPVSVRASPDGGRAVTLLYLGDVLEHVTLSGARPIAGQVGETSSVLLQHTFEGHLERVVEGDAIVSDIRLSQSDLAIHMAQEGTLSDGTFTLDVAGVSSLAGYSNEGTSSAWSFPLAEALGDPATAALWGREFVSAPGPGFLLLAEAYRGSFSILTASPLSVAEGQSVLFLLNSEGGQVCLDR